MSIFRKEEEVIKKLTETLDKLKYIQNCFVDMTDTGSILSKIEGGMLLKTTLPTSTSDYKLLSEYHIAVSNIYSTITECIDKVKLSFEPAIDITSDDKSIYIKIELSKKLEKKMIEAIEPVGFHRYDDRFYHRRYDKLDYRDSNDRWKIF